MGLRRFSFALARQNQGQASFLIGMMMLTFLLFFTFIINTGLLINAKINLQNAADLAAYAGASVQARQLNQISYLNYEMRRQYKKFLFRYYVMGNQAQKMHPGNPGAPTTGTRVWSPSSSPVVNYNVPSVCLIFNNSDNFCQLAKLDSIRIPPPSPLDAMQTVLSDQLKALELIRQDNCRSIGENNKLILNFWLWNTDPKLTAFDSAPADLRQRVAVIKGLVFGLGLFPKEILLRKRIETLDQYVNFERQQEVTKAQVDAMAQSIDAAKRERTVQAFRTAYETLGEHTFSNAEEIILDELVPGQLLKLETVSLPEFTVYSVDFNPVTAGGNGSNPGDCRAELLPFNISNLPVGVKKDPTILTYYAVRLKAKADIMFSPFGPVTLKAYAAAQPFGSRIGPRIDSNVFLREAMYPGCQFANANSSGGAPGGAGGRFCTEFVPNLPIRKDEGSGTGEGWDRNEVIYAMYRQFADQTGPAGPTGQLPSVITPKHMERAYQAAMVPNPWEQGKYNIINDLNNDPFVRNFPSAEDIHAMWAPLISPEEGTSDLDQEVAGMIDEFTAPISAQNASQDPNALDGLSPQYKEALKNGFLSYIQLLRSGAGENGNGFTIARLVNPFTTRPDTGPPQPIQGLGPEIFLNSPELVKTSWNEVKDKDLMVKGRTGYSVKFVSFQNLLNPATTSDGQGATWSNRPYRDSEAEADLAKIRH